MPLPFGAIQFRECEGYYLGGDPLHSLPMTGRVNILVGPNNSGKSRLLRHLAACNSYGLSVDAPDVNRARTAVARCQDAFRQVLDNTSIDSIGRIKRENLSQLAIPDFLLTTGTSLSEAHGLIRSVADLSDMGTVHRSATYSGDKPRKMRDYERLWEEAKTAAPAVETLASSLGNLLRVSHRVYIPVLRGLRPLEAIMATTPQSWARQSRTQIDYFGKDKKGESDPTIFTGEDLYDRVIALRLGTRSERQQLDRYESFLSREFFGGQEVGLIPRWDRREQKVLDLKVGNDERPIFELGDGLQSIIILTFLAFEHTDAFFFVEEPELFLHPGLQRRLLTFMATPDDDRRHTWFLTTHSNHFLDMTFEFPQVAIYRVGRREPSTEGNSATFHVEQLDQGDFSALEALGVRNSSVFLANATIWVEGITDRMYLRHLLELVPANTGRGKIREDIDYCFVEYGGGNLVHFSVVEGRDKINIERLCSRALVVADKDAGKEQRHSAIEAKIGDRFVLTCGREVENMLPESVVLEVVRSFEGDPELYVEGLAREGESGYRDEPLGAYLDRKIGRSASRRGGYAAPSGTVKNKVAFATKALQAMKELQWTDLDSDVQKLVRRIYDFVAEMREGVTG